MTRITPAPILVRILSCAELVLRIGCGEHFSDRPVVRGTRETTERCQARSDGHRQKRAGHHFLRTPDMGRQDRASALRQRSRAADAAPEGRARRRSRRTDAAAMLLCQLEIPLGRPDWTRQTNRRTERAVTQRQAWVRPLSLWRAYEAATEQSRLLPPARTDVIAPHSCSKSRDQQCPL